MPSQQNARIAAAVAVAAAALIVIQAALAATPDPRKQPLDQPNAADNARARASIVQLSDLVRGFRVQRSKASTPVIPHCADFPGDRSDITITGAASSSFIHASNTIASTALFFKTWADSDRYWAKTVRPRYATCLAAVFRYRGVKPRIVRAKQIKIGATGADAARAYRMIAQVALPGRKPFYWTETAAFVKVGRGIAMIRVIYLNAICECHTGIGIDLTRRLRAAQQG